MITCEHFLSLKEDLILNLKSRMNYFFTNDTYVASTFLCYTNRLMSLKNLTSLNSYNLFKICSDMMFIKDESLRKEYIDRAKNYIRTLVNEVTDSPEGLIHYLFDLLI